MELEYRGKLWVNRERVNPKAPNSCRPTVVANAANILCGYHGDDLITPENILEIINFHREAAGINNVDLNTDIISDEEIAFFVRNYLPQMEITAIEGGGCVKYELLKKLVEEEGIVAVIDHQQIYVDPKEPQKNNINYLPSALLERLVTNKKFSYEDYKELCSFFIKRVGYFEEGHVDIIMDIREVDGVSMVILANLGSRDNEYPIAIPWNLFRNYLLIDWSGPEMTDINELPDEREMEKLFKDGDLKFAGRDFYFASFEIYYLKEKESKLKEILKEYSVEIVPPAPDF